MNDRNPIFHSLAVIEEHIQERLTVESLADSIHFSKYHYQRMFRETVGESVMRYVTERKLSLAAADLAGTDASILETALKYGYDSHEGFSRSFKAYMGVSPREYRKYHFSISSPKMQKERYAMTYSKTTDEIIRELNNLIVQARETAAYTRKNRETAQEGSTFYTGFWDVTASKTEAMADELSAVLERITDIPQRPDEISARFLIVKAIEDAAFKSHITAFQTRLTIARAMPQHRAAFEPVCSKYDELARNAQMKTDRIVKFFNELTALIFQDMRENAVGKLQDAAAKGRAAANNLLNVPSLPYTYIADEIQNIAEELTSTPLEEISISFLDDCLFRLDIISSTADLDILRMPSHRPLFNGITAFRETLYDTIVFFQSLSEDIIQGSETSRAGAILERTTDKMFRDLAFQGNILLFYLRGEVQKLGEKLDEKQKTRLDNICDKMDSAIHLALHPENGVSAGEIAEILHEVHREMETEAENLGQYGAPVQFIAEQVLQMSYHADMIQGI